VADEGQETKTTEVTTEETKTETSAVEVPKDAAPVVANGEPEQVVSKEAAAEEAKEEIGDVPAAAAVEAPKVPELAKVTNYELIFTFQAQFHYQGLAQCSLHPVSCGIRGGISSKLVLIVTIRRNNVWDA